MNLSEMFGSSNPTKILRNLMEKPCNNYCVDCGESSASNVDCTHYTFVCVACSAIHREIGDQIKSVGVSTFSPEEIERLKETSNDDFNNTWMSGFKRGDQPLLPASNEETRRAFIFAKYRQKKWHKDSPKMANMSKRTMFPTEEDDSDDENAKYTKQSSKNTSKFDEYDEDDDENEYQNYNANQQTQQQMQNLPRGNPFGNNSYQQQQQQQNFFYQQNSYQVNQQIQQNQQPFQNNNFDEKATMSLSSSSKNAPFQKHKSSDHVHKKNKQKNVQQQQQMQFQQQQSQSQNDVLIDFMSPQQPQNSSSSMQSAIDDIFGSTAQQQQPQFSNQQYQYQQPQQNAFQQNNFQQQQQNNFQQTQQNNFQQNNFQQTQLNQKNSFPHKKNKSQQGQQKQHVQKVQQTQKVQQNSNSLDDIFGIASSQPQNQSNQVDDLFNFGLPNDSSNSHINDDELLDFNNPQIAAQQQQHYETRRQLKEAMVNIGDDDMINVSGNNNNIQKLRNEGLGVQDSPTFIAKALIASGYCSQPVNQQIPRMGMTAQQQMYYNQYQAHQQNQNQYYKPQ